MSAAAPSGLRALLEAERECCARLLLVLDAERAAAAAFDYAALIACLKERETVHADWSYAAAARRAALRADGRTLAAIAAAEPALAGVVAALRTDAAALARAQRVNASVVAAALGQVTDLLDVIGRQRPETRYDARAKLTTPVRAAGGGWSA
jgi:hypothetical protein